MNPLDIFAPELIKALLIIAPLFLIALVIVLAFNFARDLLESFLSTSFGKVFIAVALLVFAIKFW